MKNKKITKSEYITTFLVIIMIIILVLNFLKSYQIIKANKIQQDLIYLQQESLDLQNSIIDTQQKILYNQCQTLEKASLLKSPVCECFK